MYLARFSRKCVFFCCILFVLFSYLYVNLCNVIKLSNNKYHYIFCIIHINCIDKTGRTREFLRGRFVIAWQCREAGEIIGMSSTRQSGKTD